MTAAAVIVCDVAPRDGLQNDAATLAPQTRAELCARLAATGLPRVEAASFVNPRAGAADGRRRGGVRRAASAISATVFAALALNERGVQRAVAAGADEIHLAYPLTDTFGQRNQGMTVEQGAQAAEQMIAAGHEAGLRVTATLARRLRLPLRGPRRPRRGRRSRAADGGRRRR